MKVEVQVVITDEALFGNHETPGQVPGYGTPTAHTYRSTAPPLVPGKAPAQKTAVGATGIQPHPTEPPLSPFARYLTDLIAG